MPTPEIPPADRLPEWVERVKAAARRMNSLAPPVAAFGRDVQRMVEVSSQMAELLPTALYRFRRTEDCIGEGDCLSCPYATEDDGEQCFGSRLAQALERWRNGEVDER